MNRPTYLKTFLLLALLVRLSVFTIPARAERPSIPRIGILTAATTDSSWEAGLRQGLGDLAYSEGKNIVLEWKRPVKGDEELNLLASGLAKANADLIVAFGTPAARAGLAGTNRPVVFFAGDPVATGLVASLARPGGKATGLSAVTTELTAKRLELLHQLLPNARRIILLMNSANPNQLRTLQAAREAAGRLGIDLLTMDVHDNTELDVGLRTLTQRRADGVLITADVIFQANKAKLATAVRKATLPAMFPYAEYHQAGVLVSYGPNLNEVGRKMAVYVDKIIKGAKPADLPVEQIAQYEFVINLRIARDLKIKVPDELLLRADEVIR